MEPDLGQARLTGEPLEPAREPLWMERAAVPPSEHQPRVLPAGTDDQPLLGLVGSVLPERRRCRGVERQRPLALGGLGLGNVLRYTCSRCSLRSPKVEET
jgi:hypothetical protein